MSQRSTRPRKPEPRWQRRPEERPEEILDAAVQVFGENGFARTRLEDIAHRAGVSKGTLYLYFRSKEDLFREMVRARIVTVVAEAEERVERSGGTARDQLAGVIRSVWQSVSREDVARLTQVVLSELGSFPELGRFYLEEVIQRGRRLIARVLERGIAAGEFRPVDVAIASRLIPGIVVRLAQNQCAFRHLDPDVPDDAAVIEGALDLICHGVLHPGHTSSPNS
ncbi:MAG: TetR/AcrR family transcriptional regulator [Gemmatimonadales bacterium]